MQASGRVGDDDIYIARFGGMDGVEHYGRGVGPGRMFQHVAAGAFAPDF
jgi:hypothetical protein